MAQDPAKLAELQALATGGPDALAAHQAQVAQTQAAQSSALGGYGSANYQVSPELQASLAATQSQYSAPGVDASASASAAAPGLAAMDQAAAANFMTHENQTIQSRLAAAQAKIGLEEKQSLNEQQSKLAELGVQRDQMTSENQFKMGDLANQERAWEIRRAMDPDRITGQAIQDQAAAQEQARTDHKQSELAAANAQAKGQLMDSSANTPNTDSNYQQLAQEQADISKRNADLKAAGQLTQADQDLEKQLNEKLDAAIPDNSGPDSRMALAQTQSQQEALARQAAGQYAAAGYDLPQFQFDAAVQRGMDPNIAAGQFLKGQDEWILREQEREFRRENLADTEANRLGNIQKTAQSQADAAAATDVGQAAGMDPKDVLQLSRTTNLSLPDIKKAVTDKAWQDVGEAAKLAGTTLNDQQAQMLTGGDPNQPLTQAASSLKGQPFTKQLFDQYVQNSSDLSLAQKQLAWRYYANYFPPADTYAGTGLTDPNAILGNTG